MDKEEVLSIKDTVEQVLARDPRSRGDDKWLIFKVLRAMGYNIYIPYGLMEAMPSFESITRCRRKFQEEGRYLASDTTRGFRVANEEEFKKISQWF